MYAKSPYAVVERKSSYSIVLNLLGVSKEDIGIDVDLPSHELTVLAARRSAEARRRFFWSFCIPSDARIEALVARYRAGVLEILIPKFAIAAG